MTSHKSKSRKRTVRIELTSDVIRTYYRKYRDIMVVGFWLEKIGEDNAYRQHTVPWVVFSNGNVLPNTAATTYGDRYAHPVIREWCAEAALRDTFGTMLDWCRDQQKPIQRVTVRPNLCRIDFVFTNSIDATLFKLFFG